MNKKEEIKSVLEWRKGNQPFLDLQDTKDYFLNVIPNTCIPSKVIQGLSRHGLANPKSGINTAGMANMIGELTGKFGKVCDYVEELGVEE